MFMLNTPTWEPLPSAAQSTLNALTTYTGTTHVTVTAGGPEPDVGVEYFGQPGDKVTVQDMCDSFSAPGFDDSGVVEEITSFQSFYDKFVSGMKIRDFFRNLKAGLKFVLHTGQLVNNGLCNEPGKYPLDAAYGRTLLEMIGNTANLPGGAADIVSAIVTQNSNLGDVIAQSTYKTSLRSPAKTHTLGIHDNGTAYLDNDKVITNADLQSGIVTILNVPVGENEYDFNFTDIFTSAPKAIIATIQKRGYSDKLLLQANIKSAAQFTLSVYNGTASAINNISVYWIAK